MSEKEPTGSTDGKPDPVDDLVVTQHTLRSKRGTLSYTARSGRIVLRTSKSPVSTSACPSCTMSIAAPPFAVPRAGRVPSFVPL